MLQPPSARILEAVSVETDPLPPNDPLAHRYDARRPERLRPAAGEPGGGAGPAAPRRAGADAGQAQDAAGRAGVPEGADLADADLPDADPRSAEPASAGPASTDPASTDPAIADLAAADALAPERDPPPARLPASLEEFLAGLGTRAFRFAELGLRHREDALDAVQDAMMKMLGYRDRPAQEWTPLFWSILRSRIVDVQRRRAFRLRWLLPAARTEDDAPADWADDGPDPQRAHDGREAYARLAEALQKLPRRQREAFSLRVLEELDVATTARAMGCSEGAVKTHLSRAREALQRQLEEWR